MKRQAYSVPLVCITRKTLFMRCGQKSDVPREIRVLSPLLKADTEAVESRGSTALAACISTSMADMKCHCAPLLSPDLLHSGKSNGRFVKQAEKHHRTDSLSAWYGSDLDALLVEGRPFCLQDADKGSSSTWLESTFPSIQISGVVVPR